MNTPTEQATLYRKAAETIEMCAKHGIEPIVKYQEHIKKMCYLSFNNEHILYEFPVAILEGQLVWADTVIYNGHGCSFTAGNVLLVGLDIKLFTLLPPKRTVMVEFLYEDMARVIHSLERYEVPIAAKRAIEACRKALDNLKDS